MTPLLRCSFLALSLAMATGSATAQALGDAHEGFVYADGVCSECHAVKKGERVSPHERAPAFEVVANTRGMTEMALRVWFQSPHPSMPNLMLTEKNADDLVAYIMSLKQGPQTGRGL